MARKSARAIAVAEAAQSSDHEEASSSKVSPSDLSPKACLTCGRVITPRAKWAKDWNGIKYCSDRCRSTRPGRVAVSFTADADSLKELESCSGVTAKDGGEVTVDVETFVEGVLLDVARRGGGGTLEEVQDRLRDMLTGASIRIGSRQQGSTEDEDSDAGSEEGRERDSPATHPLWRALDSPPGFRERVRRAARRLALGITHDSNAGQTSKTTTDAGSIELLQGGKVLRTVQDLSFAKGVISVRSKRS